MIDKRTGCLSAEVSISGGRALWTLFCAAAVLLVAGAAPAYAQSGETDKGVYQAPAADCEVLRTRTGVEDGNVIFTCDPAREECRLVSPTGDDGLALGFCADRFPEGVEPVAEGLIEANVTVTATSFGTDIGFQRGDSSDADLLCETFVDDGAGVKACRKILEGTCSIDSEDPNFCDPDCDAYIPTVSDDCDILQGLLEAVTGDPSVPAFGLFIDVDRASEPGSEGLLVCPGFRWECVPDPGSLGETGVTVQYQFTKYIIDTPGCVKVGGTCYKY